LVKIRLKRDGTKKRPFYKIVVADVRSPRDGKFIDHIGYYHPLNADDSKLKFDAQKVQDWYLNGAQPTPVVKKLLNNAEFKFDKASFK